MLSICRLLSISYKDSIMIKNKEVINHIHGISGLWEDLPTSIKKRELKTDSYITRSSGLSKTFLWHSARGRQTIRWEDNIHKLMGMRLEKTMREAEDRLGWRKLTAKSSVAL